MADQKDRLTPAGRKAASIVAKPEDFIRYVYARDRVRGACRDLSEDAAGTALLDAYGAGEIEARPSRNFPGHLDVHLYRRQPEALRTTWWHKGDLEQLIERLIAEKEVATTQSSQPCHVGRPGIPADQLKVVLQGWADEKVLTDNWSVEAKRLAVCRRVFLSDKPGQVKGIYEHEELSAEHKRLTARSK